MSEPEQESPQRTNMARRAIVLDPDLFFAVKVTTTLKHMGMESAIVRQAPEWARRVEEERFDVALVNTAARGLQWSQAISVARAAGLPVIAYGSHVDTEAQAQARAAGATRVVANSKLAADLPTIVEQVIRRASATHERASEESSSVVADRAAQDDDA